MRANCLAFLAWEVEPGTDAGEGRRIQSHTQTPSERTISRPRVSPYLTCAPLDTATALIDSVPDQTEGEDVHYKLRTALQLPVVASDDHDRAVETLSEADLDDELRERFRELGSIG